MIEISASLGLGMIYLLIDRFRIKKFFMGPESNYPAIVHDNDAVCIFYTGNSLSDNQFCCIGNLLCKSFTDAGICSGIYCAGGIVQNQDFGLLQKRPGNTETLLLSTGNIGSALFNKGMVFVRHSLDKAVCTGKFTGMAAFFFRGIFIPPAEIV